MVAVLDELGLSRLADIPGLTAVGAAAILAETSTTCKPARPTTYATRSKRTWPSCSPPWPSADGRPLLEALPLEGVLVTADAMQMTPGQSPLPAGRQERALPGPDLGNQPGLYAALDTLDWENAPS